MAMLTTSDKHASLFQQDKNYSSKKFYGTGDSDD